MIRIHQRFVDGRQPTPLLTLRKYYSSATLLDAAPGVVYKCFSKSVKSRGSTSRDLGILSKYSNIIQDTPQKINMEPKITQLKRKIIFHTIIFRFHVNLPGCRSINQIFPRKIAGSSCGICQFRGSCAATVGENSAF